MPVRVILTRHPVAVTLRHVVQRNAHLDEAHAPRLLTLHLAGAEHHQVADSRTAAIYYGVSLGLPRGRLKYCHGTGRCEDVRVATLTTGAGVGPHRRPALAATSGACSH
jgi:hypothetical protein